MLKNPKWDEPPQPHHPSLDGMIDWMETKDPNMRYDYRNCMTCLCAQYYKECTHLKFIKMYDAQNNMAHFLNTKVASLATVSNKFVDGGYSIRAALIRARAEKQRMSVA
jgi:hypothetical protein